MAKHEVKHFRSEVTFWKHVLECRIRHEVIRALSGTGFPKHQNYGSERECLHQFDFLFLGEKTEPVQVKW